MLSTLAMPSFLAATPYNRQVSEMNCIGPIARSTAASPSRPPPSLSTMRRVPPVPSRRTPRIGGLTSPLGAIVRPGRFRGDSPPARCPPAWSTQDDTWDSRPRRASGVGVGLQRDDRNSQCRSTFLRPFAQLIRGPAAGVRIHRRHRIAGRRRHAVGDEKAQLPSAARRQQHRVAPITATARNQRLGDTTLPRRAPIPASVTIIVPWVC